jgi:transposase
MKLPDAFRNWPKLFTTVSVLPLGRRLDAILGVGPTLATALVARVADPKAFQSGRDFSAWVGRVPKQNSSGGRAVAVRDIWPADITHAWDYE